MSWQCIWSEQLWFFFFLFFCHIYRHFSLLRNFVLVCKFSGDKQTQKLPEQGCVEPEKNRTCSFETPNLCLDKSWSPGAYIYIAKPTININAQNVSPRKELRIHSGNKDLQINKKGEKRDLIRKCTVFQQYHHLPHPVTKNRTWPCRNKLCCDLLTLLLFFKLFKYHEYKIILMKDNYIWAWIYCEASTVAEIMCFS